MSLRAEAARLGIDPEILHKMERGIIDPKMRKPLSECIRFDDSPDAGDPACVCSACRLAIPASDVPFVRCTEGDKELRFHRGCEPPEFGTIYWPDPIDGDDS